MYRTVLDLSTGLESQVELTQQEIDALQNTLPPDLPPDWNTLYARLLAYDLRPIFEGIKAIAKTNTAINWDLTALATAIATIRTEQALRDCLDELIADGYVVSAEHKSLWNNAIAQLNFSDLVKLI